MMSMTILDRETCSGPRCGFTENIYTNFSELERQDQFYLSSAPWSSRFLFDWIRNGTISREGIAVTRFFRKLYTDLMGEKEDKK